MKKILIIILATIFIINGIFLILSFKNNFLVTLSEQIKDTDKFKVSIENIINRIQEEAFGLPENSFDQGVTEETDEIFEQYFSAVQSSEIFRIKVWGKDHTVLWSDSDALIGQKFPDNHELEEALEGEIEIETKFKDGSNENFLEYGYSNFAEVYVPIKVDSGEIIGVIETYSSTQSIIDFYRSQFFLHLYVSTFGWVIIIIIIYVYIRTRKKQKYPIPGRRI